MQGLDKMKKSGICAIAKNEEKYILEWISHHILVGFDAITIYDNESDIDVSKLMLSLSHNIQIDVIKWPSKEGVSPQLSAYNDYVSRYKDEIEYTAFIDLDEFVFIDGKLKINEYLNKHHGAGSAFAMNQLCFGSSGHKDYVKDLVTRRFNRSSPIIFEENNYFKSIAKTKDIKEIVDCHWVLLNEGDYKNSEGEDLIRDLSHKGIAKNPSHKSLILHHYILKSKEEFTIKRNRGGGISTTLHARLNKYDENAFSSRDSAYQKIYNLPSEYFNEVIINMNSLVKSEEARRIYSQYYDFI